MPHPSCLRVRTVNVKRAGVNVLLFWKAKISLNSRLISGKGQTCPTCQQNPSGMHSTSAIQCPLPRKWNSCWISPPGNEIPAEPLPRNEIPAESLPVSLSVRNGMEQTEAPSAHPAVPGEPAQHPPAHTQQAQIPTIYLPRSCCFASSSPGHVTLSSAPKRHSVLGKDICILKAFPLTGFSSF